MPTNHTYRHWLCLSQTGQRVDQKPSFPEQGAENIAVWTARRREQTHRKADPRKRQTGKTFLSCTVGVINAPWEGIAGKGTLAARRRLRLQEQFPTKNTEATRKLSQRLD